MSRVTKAIKNIKISVFFYSLFILLQFFSRKIFLDHLGDEFMGLTGTLQGFLSFLNLAELGIGTAVGFSLYKPLFEKNHKEINNIINLFGFLYKKIGLIILLLGIILSCFFPLIFDTISFSIGIVYYVFFAYLIGSLLGYFYNYQLFLLEADQKNYVVTSYFQSFNLVKIILQTLVAFYLQNFVLWITLELVFALGYSIFLRKKISKEYPWLISKKGMDKSILKEYPVLITKVKQITAHKVGGFVTNGTDKILIFIFISVESVAFFGNYQLIFSKLISLINTAFSGTSAGIGNLVAENNKMAINKVFWEMMGLRFFIAGFLTISLLHLVDPFIILWLGEKYLLDHDVLILFLANMFIVQVRVPVDHFKDAYGLFQDTWAPIAQSILNLGVSLILVKQWGLSGILFGTFVAFSTIIMIWRPYYLYKYGFKNNIWEYWKEFLKMTIALLLTYFLTQKILQQFEIKTPTNFIDLMFLGIKISFATLLIYASLLYTTSKGFRNVTKRIYKLIF